MKIRIRRFIHELLYFGVKQAYACLFGAILLTLIMGTRLFWRPDYILSRYDFLFISALIMQIVLLISKLETWEECRVIFIFHIVGTVMEIFKTHMGSWAYPEPSLIRIGGVPLFSGFMYSSVGSYMARAWKIFAFRYTHFPRRAAMMLLCVLIFHWAGDKPSPLGGICISGSYPIDFYWSPQADARKNL